MKKLLLITFVILLNYSCKKEEQTTTAGVKNPTFTLKQSTTSTLFNAKITSVNVKSQGAKGDGVTDDTQAIVNAIGYAFANNVPNVYFPDGTYLIKQPGNASGIIALANGVGLLGNGPATCHIKLSGGRHNPSALFYQAWWNSPSISNMIVQGIDFDGALFSQTFDASYQYCHALSINNGQNIEVENCKFENFRGDGLLFGDTFESSLNLRITYNISVHDNEFFNIYREGTMFCCTNGGAFYNNNVHGNGYLVGGVDIERHSVNETVLNISVHDNIFNFDDGYGPVERGGPVVRYRRAVTMGFFYAGYPNGIADNKSGSHQIYNNTIYQGQIDCWGHINVSITNNAFTNTYEKITGVGWLSAPAVNISDPATTSGLINVGVNNNKINSAMAGNGITFSHYSNVAATSNTISGMQVDGISILNATGQISSNTIQNVGLTTKGASGIVINGNTSGLTVSKNIVKDTRSGASRTVNYAVALQSTNSGNVPPAIEYNQGSNLLGVVVSQYYYQLGYATLVGNTSN